MTKQVAILYKGDKPSYLEEEGTEYTYVKNPWHVKDKIFDGIIIDDMSIDKVLVEKMMSHVRSDYENI